MVQLDLDLDLFQQELKNVDILDIGDVSLHTCVALQDRILHVLRKVVMLNILSGALWTHDHREERV